MLIKSFTKWRILGVKPKRGERFAEGRYIVARVRFEPVTFQLPAQNPTATPQRSKRWIPGKRKGKRGSSRLKWMQIIRNDLKHYLCVFEKMLRKLQVTELCVGAVCCLMCCWHMKTNEEREEIFGREWENKEVVECENFSILNESYSFLFQSESIYFVSWNKPNCHWSFEFCVFIRSQIDECSECSHFYLFYLQFFCWFAGGPAPSTVLCNMAASQ